MGASEQIRVSSDVKTALEEQKRPGESYNEVVERLIEEQVEQRRASIRDGAGLWEDTDAAEGAKNARDELKDEIGPEV